MTFSSSHHCQHRVNVLPAFGLHVRGCLPQWSVDVLMVSHHWSQMFIPDRHTYRLQTFSADWKTLIQPLTLEANVIMYQKKVSPQKSYNLVWHAIFYSLRYPYVIYHCYNWLPKGFWSGWSDGGVLHSEHYTISNAAQINGKNHAKC